MSRPNKVNKTNYDQGGRLTPDEMARERQKQARLGVIRFTIASRLGHSGRVGAAAKRAPLALEARLKNERYHGAVAAHARINAIRF
jgi:hypothetical protein